MKKILSTLGLLFIASIIYSQSLDTIYVRNLALRAEEWYWLKGGWTPKGTAEKQTWKKIRIAILAAGGGQSPSNGTVVTIDSIPGAIALMFYHEFLSTEKGETDFMTNDIKNKIEDYNPLDAFTTLVRDRKQNRFQTRRQNGREDVDN